MNRVERGSGESGIVCDFGIGGVPRPIIEIFCCIFPNSSCQCFFLLFLMTCFMDLQGLSGLSSSTLVSIGNQSAERNRQISSNALPHFSRFLAERSK